MVMQKGLRRMTKPYKEMDKSELKLERARLINILQNHPKPNTYKQTKKSLERVNNLLAERIVNEITSTN